jgi:hypothetical protein
MQGNEITWIKLVLTLRGVKEIEGILKSGS